MLTLITNTIIPYCYDVAQIVGLPNQCSHRFRYKSDWVKLPYKILEAKRRVGMVVLRDFESGRLLPLRYIYVEDVLSIGEIHYLEFRVLDYVPAKQRGSVCDAINAHLTSQSVENKGGVHLTHLVVDAASLGASVPVQNADEWHQHWSAILCELGQLQCYKDFGFLRVLHIRDASGQLAALSPDERGKHSFVLHPSHLYFLDVVQHVPWEIHKTEAIDAPYDVALTAETDAIKVLRGVQRVVGKYDLLRFIFKTPTGYLPKHSFLEIENRQEGVSAKYKLPALFLPIRVRLQWWMRALLTTRVCLIVIGVVAFVLAETIAKIADADPGTVRSVSLLVMVLISWKWEEYVVALFQDVKGIAPK